MISRAEPNLLMHQKFLALGNMQGKTSDEIVSALGGPSAVIRRDEGSTLMEWSARGSRVRLCFDEQRRFVKVSHACIPIAVSVGEAPRTTNAKWLGVLMGLALVVCLLINMLVMFR